MGRFGMLHDDDDNSVDSHDRNPDDGDCYVSPDDDPLSDMRNSTSRPLTNGSAVHHNSRNSIDQSNESYSDDRVHFYNVFYDTRNLDPYQDESRMELRQRHYTRVTKSKRRFYFAMISHGLPIVFLIVMQYYMPPPPPPVTTWGEYVSHSTQGIQATITHVAALTIYIVTGCFHNVKEDLKTRNFGIRTRMYHSFKGSSSGSGDDEYVPSCPLRVPGAGLPDVVTMGTSAHDSAVDNIYNILQSRIAGQGNAIRMISSTLGTWDGGVPSDKDHSFQESKAQHETVSYQTGRGGRRKRNRPLNMIFTGPDGVGKYETAKQVADLLMHGCQRPEFHDTFHCQNDACLGENQGRVLELQGIDYALENKGLARDFIRHILKHIYRQGENQGAIVLIRHVEYLGQGAKQELVRLLTKSYVSFSLQDSRDSRRVLEEGSVANNHFLESFLFRSGDDDMIKTSREEVSVALDHCVFLMTTDIGTDRIFKGLSHSMLRTIELYNHVQRQIEEDVQEYFGARHIFDVVAPFWPLQFTEMKEIVRQKMSRESTKYKIELTENAIEHLAGPTLVEYMAFKMAGQEDSESFIFATRGGHDLIGYKSIVKSVEEQLQREAFFHEKEVVRVDFVEGEWIMQICTHEEDVDDTQDTLCVGRGVLQMERFF